MVKVISVVVCLIVLAGYSVRRTRSWHARFMTAAFLLDMTLLLYVELTRKAIKTSVSLPHPFVTFHVLISVATIGLYLGQLYTGVRAYRGRARTVKHGSRGRWFLGLRAANLITSFFVGFFVPHGEPMDKENISDLSRQISRESADPQPSAKEENRT